MHPNVQCTYKITLDYLSFRMHHLGSWFFERTLRMRSSISFVQVCMVPLGGWGEGGVWYTYVVSRCVLNFSIHTVGRNFLTILRCFLFKTRLNGVLAATLFFSSLVPGINYLFCHFFLSVLFCLTFEYKYSGTNMDSNAWNGQHNFQSGLQVVNCLRQCCEMYIWTIVLCLKLVLLYIFVLP